MVEMAEVKGAAGEGGGMAVVGMVEGRAAKEVVARVGRGRWRWRWRWWRRRWWGWWRRRRGDGGGRGWRWGWRWWGRWW